MTAIHLSRARCLQRRLRLRPSAVRIKEPLCPETGGACLNVRTDGHGSANSHLTAGRLSPILLAQGQQWVLRVRIGVFSECVELVPLLGREVARSSRTCVRFLLAQQWTSSALPTDTPIVSNESL
jgi:hypothetical protein